MKEKNKILITFLVMVIVICSIFTFIIEYQIINITKAEEEEYPLRVNIEVDENYGAIPFNVSFKPEVWYYTGNVYYNWNFGDNETSRKINPNHTYNKIGVFDCNLTITDSSGEKASDHIKITVRENEAPIVSIILSDLKPSRPFIPIIRHQFFSQYYFGQNFRRIIDSDLFPKFLLNLTGFVNCYAEASSPEGNNIEKYEWELQPPIYNTITGNQIKPLYKFKGQNLTIPLLYIYPEAPYDLTAIVTDSKGFKGTSTIKFEVQLHKTESRIRSIKTSLSIIRQQIWHNVLKAIYGETAADIIYENLFQKAPGGTLIKLFAIAILFKNWGLGPDKSLTYDLLAQFLEKHTFLRNITINIHIGLITWLEKLKEKYPDQATLLDNIINRMELSLENLGISNRRPILSDESPSDNSKFLNTNYPEVAIKVEDPEGDTFNITIHGQYINNITLLNQKNNTFIATLKTPLPNLTSIKWHVNISYPQNKWINATYKFSTW